MGRIFISYRRQDSQWSSRSIFDRLERDFGPNSIFFDVDMIPGVDFVNTIKDNISNCDVVLVIIGINWIYEIKRRAKSSNDFVRIEIENAIITNRVIIPVLVDNALMPEEKQLPFSIKALCRRNAMTISAMKFSPDMHKLVVAINNKFEEIDKKRTEAAAIDERKKQTAEQEMARIALEARRKSEAGEASTEGERQEPRSDTRSAAFQYTASYSQSAVLRHRRKGNNFKNMIQFNYAPNRFLASNSTSYFFYILLIIIFIIISSLHSDYPQ